MLVGASLGGATAIDFALSHPEAVQKLVLVDGQAWAEGLGPISLLPRWAASLGVKAGALPAHVLPVTLVALYKVARLSSGFPPLGASQRFVIWCNLITESTLSIYAS